MSTLSVVLPCHNEAEAIPSLLVSLKRTIERLVQRKDISSCQVLVVDDASSDETFSLLKNYDWVQTIRLERRSGYGAALKAGFSQATGDWIAFLDLDGTYDPEDLELLLTNLKGKNADFACGERLSSGAGMPFLRKIGNSCFSLLVRLLYRTTIKDACTGFRIFHKRWTEDLLALKKNGLDYSLAITLWSVKNKLPAHEIPIRYHLRHGQSKLRILPDGNKFFWTILSTRFSPAKSTNNGFYKRY